MIHHALTPWVICHDDSLRLTGGTSAKDDRSTIEHVYSGIIDVVISRPLRKKRSAAAAVTAEKKKNPEDYRS